MRKASRFTRRLAVAGTVLALFIAGIAAAGQWPYVMTFYDDAGNAVGWQIGHCDNSYSFFGQRTPVYTIERLQCPDN